MNVAEWEDDAAVKETITFKVIGCADLLGRFSAEDTFVLQLLGVVYDGRDGGNDGRALG